MTIHVHCFTSDRDKTVLLSALRVMQNLHEPLVLFHLLNFFSFLQEQKQHRDTALSAITVCMKKRFSFLWSRVLYNEKYVAAIPHF